MGRRTAPFQAFLISLRVPRGITPQHPSTDPSCFARLLDSQNTTAEKLLYGNVFWYFALMLTAVIVNLLLSIVGYVCHRRHPGACRPPQYSRILGKHQAGRGLEQGKVRRAPYAYQIS